MVKNILVLDDGTEISAGTVGHNAILSLTATETVSKTTDLCPGAACSNKLEITIWVEPGTDLPITSGTRLTHYRETSGHRTLAGTYWAVKPTSQTRNTYKIYAYDAVSLLDGVQSTWLRSIQDQFPMTLWKFAGLVAQRCGVTIVNSSLPRNGTYLVQAFYADNLTGRQLLAWVAEASCTFLRATSDGKIEFAWYTDYNTSQSIGPTVYIRDGLSHDKFQTAPVVKVQIRQSDDDVGVLYPSDESGSNALVIQGNLLLTSATAEALKPVAQAIFETMQGVTYTPLKVTVPADFPLPAPGNIVSVTDARGNVLSSYIMTRTISGQQVTLESTGNATRAGTAAVNEQSYKNLTGKMLEIKTSVDGLSVKASELSGNYSALSQTVEGFKTEVQETVSSQNEKISTVESNYSSLSQTVSGLSSTVSSVKTTANNAASKANNAASKADSAAAKADSALSDAKNYTNGQLETVKGELSTKIEQTPNRLKLSVLRTGYFPLFEYIPWTNWTAGTFGNVITLNSSGITAARLITTEADSLAYARGSTLKGALSYQVHKAIVGKSSSAHLRLSFVVIYADGTNTSQHILYEDGKKTMAAVRPKTSAALNLTVEDKKIKQIYVEVLTDRCSGKIEVGEVWANVEELSGKSTTLSLTADGARISSANIVLKGAVSFEDLSGSGTTTINGSNITTGTIANADRSALFDLDGKRFRMGTSSGARVFIDKSGIQWYGGTATTGATAQGVIKNGLTTGATGDTTVYGADTRYQKYGWYHGGRFQGITVEQVDNEVMVSGKLSVNQAVSCRTLKAWDAKERIVPTVFGNIGMEALETPQPTFADWGEGVCNEDGLCLAVPDARFAETVSASQRPAWIVTDRSGEGSLWAQDYADGALIHGKPGQRFAWLCLNAQRGFEGQYAVLSDAKEPSSEDGDWLLCYTGDLAQQEEENLDELLLKEAEQ